ncbi:hypothetical protein AB0K60_30995 [Thermopolyspora sp. NPDC052614]|uniref:hypothetical protein n=1 Tax=Thermopolyspora sp. NPDC052614 TaxID=3155682 RepID=UPI003449FD08
MPRFAPYRQGGAGAPDLLDIAERTFQLLCRDGGPLRVDGEVIGYGLPPRPITLAELRLILSHPAIGHPVRDAAWRPLIRLAREHGDVWIIGCLGLALPVLRRMAGRLSGGPGDAADVTAEVVVAFTHALHGLNLDRPRLTPRLYRATRLACARPAAPGGPVPVAPQTFDTIVSGAPADHPDLLLARAVAQGVISRADARLIGVTRLESVPLRAVAEGLAVPYDVLRRRRAAAESRLRAAVLDGRLRAG